MAFPRIENCDRRFRTRTFGIWLSRILCSSVLCLFFAIDYFNRHVWVFGTWMCKVCRSVSKINMYSSIFFLTALSVDRTLAVTRPTTTTWLRTRQGIRNISIGIWISSCVLMIPELVYSTDVRVDYNHSVCGMSFPKSQNATEDAWYIKMGLYELTKCVLGFFGPICIILYSYSAILYTVQWKLIGSRDGKSRATKLAAIIVTTFIICWLPFQALTLQSALGGFLEWGISMNARQKFIHKKIMPYAISLAYTNSAVNPILYAFTLRPFRDTLKSNFLCKFRSLGSDVEPHPAKKYAPVPVQDSNNMSTDDKLLSPKSREDSQITHLTALTNTSITRNSSLFRLQDASSL